MTSPRLTTRPAARAPQWLILALLVPVLVVLLPETALAAAEGEHESIWATIARLANFAILVGVLAYFLKGPIAGHIASRGTQIRHDLVTAKEMRATAAAQLADIEKKLALLPAELDALKHQGADDVRAEQARIAQAAATERERLLDTTRREIEMRLRVARRELTEHAAALAVGIAEDRIRRNITPEDQLRLIDQYTSQLRGSAPAREAR